MFYSRNYGKFGDPKLSLPIQILTQRGPRILGYQEISDTSILYEHLLKNKEKWYLNSEGSNHMKKIKSYLNLYLILVEVTKALETTLKEK